MTVTLNPTARDALLHLALAQPAGSCPSSLDEVLDAAATVDRCPRSWCECHHTRPADCTFVAWAGECPDCLAHWTDLLAQALEDLADRLDRALTPECPTCHGDGEVNVCPDSCDGSHIGDYTERCRCTLEDE